MILYFAFSTVFVKLVALFLLDLKDRSTKHFSRQIFHGKQILEINWLSLEIIWSGLKINWLICGRTAATVTASGRSETSATSSTNWTSSTIGFPSLIGFRATFTGLLKFRRGVSLTSPKLRPEMIQVQS
jgi:hypothetical protein